MKWDTSTLTPSGFWQPHAVIGAPGADVTQHVKVLREHHHLNDILGVDVIYVAAEVLDAVAQAVDDGLPLPRHSLPPQVLGLCSISTSSKHSPLRLPRWARL